MTAEGTLNGKLFEGSIKGGTPQLFPSKELLSDRARYPRGFTPDRLREVQSTTGLKPQEHHHSRAAAIAGVRDTLAASTAPLEHMKGRGPGSIHWHAGPGVDPLIGDSLGQYNDKGGFGTAMIRNGQERTATVIHELGHHISNMAGTPHSSYDTTTHMGHEEAYAENYSDTHFRDRRGRGVQTARKDATAWTQDGRRGGRYGGFHEAWDAKRAESPVVARDNADKARKTERMMNGLDHPLTPRGHVLGQVPLLEGHSQGHGADEAVDWDYTAEHRASGVTRETATPRLTENARKIRARRAQMPLSRIKYTP